MDRVLYSPEFRRLSGVTQVVPPQLDYQFHDRLSHSVKVAQVASSLARKLLHDGQQADSTLPKDIRRNLLQWVDPDYCYVAALVHDIGHPPFGHAGEQAIQQYCRTAAIIYADEKIKRTIPENDTNDSTLERIQKRSFEGNAQSMRVVTKLSFRTDEESPDQGLNLTLRSLAAIAKYPWLKGEHPESHEKLEQKWSFYQEESDILKSLVGNGADGYVLPIASDGHVLYVYRWVEAEIMDWADDISYAVHDLEDFFRTGLIPLDRIRSVLHGRHADWKGTKFDSTDDDVLRTSLLLARDKLYRVARDILQDPSGSNVDSVVVKAFNQIRKFADEGMPWSPFSGLKQSHVRLRQFSSRLITYFSNAASLQYMPNVQRVQLSINPEAVLVAEFFKSLNKSFVIDSAMLAAAQYGQNGDIKILCDSLFDMATNWFISAPDQQGYANSRLPPRLRDNISIMISTENPPNDDSIKRNQIIMISVIDYVCSLSDYQASRLTAQLAGSSSMGVFEGRWLDI